MNRIAVILLAAALFGLLWVVLDSSGDRAAEEQNDAAPARPADEPYSPPPGEVPAPPPDATARGPVSISGIVLSPAGERAAGARVRAVPLDPESWPRARRPAAGTECDELGRFVVHRLPAGLYRVEARTKKARGYHPILPVREGRETVVTVRLQPVASIAGVVVTESGVPVPGARVSADLGGVLRAIQAAVGVTGLPLEGKLDAVTGESGAFRIGDLPVGQYELEVKANGYVPRRVPFVNAPNPAIRIELVDTFAVRGEVTWETKSPPKSVRVFDEETQAETVLVPSRSPAFELRGLPRGPHTIRAIADDGAMASVRIEIAPGAGNDGLRLALERSVAVKGRVRDEDGRRSGGRFEVLAVEKRADGFRLIPITSFEVGQDGGYEVLLCRGDWIFRPVQPGLQTAEYVRAFQHGELLRYGFGKEEIVRVGGGSAWREVRVRHVGYVSGRVTRTGGWPVVGQKIEVDGVQAAVTDVAGHFRLTNLPFDRRLRISAGSESSEVRLTAKKQTAECEFVFRSSGTGRVRGQVVSEENQPVPGVTVLFRDGFAVTDIDGRFEREGMDSGRHDVRFYAPGYALGMRSQVDVARDGLTEMPLMVLPWSGFRVGGRVLDSDGIPVPGARVRVVFPGVSTVFDTVTDEGGWFRQEGPGGIPGKAYVTVNATGYTSGGTSVPAGTAAESIEFGLRPAHGIRIRFDAPARGVLYLRIKLKADVKLRRDEVQLAVKPGARHVDLEDLPPGKYRLYVYIGKHYHDRVDVDTREAKGMVEAGPIRLSR